MIFFLLLALALSPIIAMIFGGTSRQRLLSILALLLVLLITASVQAGGECPDGYYPIWYYIFGQVRYICLPQF